MKYYQSDHVSAIRAAEESLKAKGESSVPEIEAICHIVIGVCTFFEWRDRPQALKHLQMAVELAKESGIAWIKALAISNLSFLRVVGRPMLPALSSEERLQIVRASKESIEMADSIEGPWIKAHVLVNHGRILKYDGNEREGAYYEALPIWLRMGDTFGVLQCLECLAEVATEKRDFERAARLFGAQTALEEDGRVKLAIHHLAEHAKNLGAVRDGLGALDFSTHFEAGRRSPISEVLKELLVSRL